jgi:hypothetical protein
VLNQAIPATTEEVDKVIDHTLNYAYRYTALLENSKSEMIGNLSRNVVRDCLINVRQHEVCLKTLLHDIINCAKNVENLESQLAIHLDQLKSTVQSKSAIPTAQVYVKYKAIFNILNLILKYF